MGHDHTGPDWLEQGMSNWLCRFFTRHNILHRYDQIESGRGNVIARLDGAADRPTILLDAHQDTVPVAGMTIAPFDPIEREGRLYGRGACDVKGAMAAILSAVARLSRTDPHSRANVIVSMTCDEELGQIGARDLKRRFAIGDDFLPKKPDMAVIAEPTQLDVVVAHKGVLRWRIQTDGLAVHSSRPALGNSAIYSMARIVTALEKLAEQLQSPGQDHSQNHPLCGRPTLSVGTINGGESVNIVPDRCVIEVDRRVVPGESFETILRETRQWLSGQTNIDFKMLPPDTTCPPLLDRNNQSLAQSLTAITRQNGANSQSIGVAFATHAPQFADEGIPTVVFGPGSIDQAHTKDEWIDIQQMDQCSEILYDLVKRS